LEILVFVHWLKCVGDPPKSSGCYVQICGFITCMLQVYECRRIKAYSKNNWTHSCI